MNSLGSTVCFSEPPTSSARSSGGIHGDPGVWARMRGSVADRRWPCTGTAFLTSGPSRGKVEGVGGGAIAGWTDDAVLVAGCRAGDEQAWRALVERYAPYVHAIAVRAYRLSADDAEELFQEVFARAYERLDTLRDDAALRPWLGQIARRLALDRVRAGGREEPSAFDDGAQPPEPVDALARLEEALVVRDGLRRLPEHCREILERFFVRDESYRTIADALDLPAGTIASRVSRCLARLREELSQHEGRSEAPGPS